MSNPQQPQQATKSFGMHVAPVAQVIPHPDGIATEQPSSGPKPEREETGMSMKGTGMSMKSVVVAAAVAASVAITALTGTAGLANAAPACRGTDYRCLHPAAPTPTAAPNTETTPAAHGVTTGGMTPQDELQLTPQEQAEILQANGETLGAAQEAALLAALEAQQSSEPGITSTGP